MRLKPPDLDALDEEQARVYAIMKSGPRGGAPGPLALWLRRPALAERAQTLGEYCRFGSSLEPRLSELGILVTARAWTSQYEWFVHKKFALKAGLAPEIVEAVRRGERPDFANEEEAAVHDFARELHARRKVSDETYARAEAVLGEARLVDLVALLGYYCLVSMTLNVFEIPLPEGVAPELDEPADG